MNSADRHEARYRRRIEAEWKLSDHAHRQRMILIPYSATVISIDLI